MSDIRNAIVNAIYGQESNYGKADTSKVNDQNVTGPMQVQRGTFDGLKKLGLIPADYDFKNPAHTKAAGVAEVNRLADKFGNDPDKVFAAYYAGEKAVNADGTINRHWGNRKHPGHPTVGQYIEQARKKMGTPAQDSPVAAPPAAASTPGSPLVDNGAWNRTVSPHSIEVRDPAERQTGYDKHVALAGVAAGPAFVDDDRAFEAAQAAGVAATRRQAEKDAVGGRDKFNASLLENIAGSAWRWNARRQFDMEHGPAVPGFSVPPEALEGRTEDERDALMEATNDAQLRYRLWEQDQRKEREQTIGAGGKWSALGWGLAGSLADPVSVVGGYGVAKGVGVAGYGSLALAKAGRPGAAAASAYLENASVNLLSERAQEAMGDHRTTADYLAAGAFALLPTIGHGYVAFRTGERELLEQGVKRQVQDAVDKQVALVQQAERNLGEGATPRQIADEMNRLETAQLKAPLDQSIARLGEDRRLLPEDNGLRLDEEDLTPASPELDVTKMGDRAIANEFGEKALPLYDDRGFLARREHVARTNEEWNRQMRVISDGDHDFASAAALRPGVHLTAKGADDEAMIPVERAIKGMYEKFLGGRDVRLVLGTASNNAKANGEAISAGNVHFIGVRPGSSPAEMVRVAMHEMGHVIFHEHAKDISPELMGRMKGDYRAFLSAIKSGDFDTAANKRFGLTSASREVSDATMRDPTARGYIASFDEYVAENFVKYLEGKAADGKGEAVGLTARIIQDIKYAIQNALDFFRSAKRQGYIKPDESFAEFFEQVLEGKLGRQVQREAPEFLAPDLKFPGEYSMANLSDPFLTERGLDLLPTDTPARTSELKAIAGLHRRAAEWEKKHPMDEAWLKRVDRLTDNNVFNVASTGLIMLKSKNPVVRMIASELLEDASGASGIRHDTAAISKWTHERLFMGNAINEVQRAYSGWRTAKGGSVVDDFTNGKLWAQFNREVASEIEARGKHGKPVSTDQAITAAADSVQSGYERMRKRQIETKTLGWASLPESSVGYMPHKMSSGKVRELSQEQSRILHDALVDQFVGIEGWDVSFSAQLASKYMDRVRHRALGGYEAPMGVHQTGAADIVEDALKAMGMSQPEVRARMQAYMKAGPGHTKRRIQMDLNKVYQTADGEFRLLDLFETDQIGLLRAQAQRVSGEVALARHGVFGKQGMSLIRRSFAHGKDGQVVDPRELEAFDQVTAEFFGDPFGTAEGKWMERARLATSVARLGGIVFNQFAEYINAIVHVGTAKTLTAVTSIPRLRGEILDKVAGKPTQNALLDSIEQVGGAEFGTDAYKMVFPFDSPDHAYPTYGRDTIGATDRLLRGASHVQGKISMWRAIHSAQQRGMAEQIVIKAARFIADGSDDVALRDMGITPELVAKLKADWGDVAKFNGRQLVEFDLTKVKDANAAFEFAQAVHRGVGQIIQGTFIGETGKWAHSGWLKMLTQFRSFSLTSMEKQWGRQVNNRGTAQAVGILLGSMSLAAPIYMSRVYLNSIGREDQDAYIDKMLAPEKIARATLNYVALSGMAGDFMEALSSVAPGMEPVGGRTGAPQGAVGNLFAPAAGYVDDIWKYAQDIDNPDKAMRVLPFSRVPFIVPALNALGD